jgi:hypothetical protein
MFNIKNFLKSNIIILLLLLTVSLQVNSAQFSTLSSSFIDPQSLPLTINNSTFPKAVIYQNNIMYAPAVEYLTMLGVDSNLQSLPSAMTINGKSAPLSLLAIGPDRYTGQNIYYLNVTATADFIGATCKGSGNQLQITITRPSGQYSVNTPGSISGSIVITRPFQSGIVRITEEYINNARMPATRDVTSCGLPQDGKFSFTNLPPGKYTITAQSSCSSQGSMSYNYSTNGYYYYITIVTTTWSKTLSLGPGENTRVELQDGKEVFSQQIQYVNQPYIYYPRGYTYP